MPNLCCCQREGKVAQSAGQGDVLLPLREASDGSQDTNALHFAREANGEKALGVAEQE